MLFQDGDELICIGDDTVTLPVLRRGVIEFTDKVPIEVSTSKLKLPEKIYGDVEERAERIYNAYKLRNRNTGVLLNGLKGSGKTLLFRILINKGLDEGLPVFICNTTADTLTAADMLHKTKQRAIVAIDEFDKVCKGEKQEELLRFLDGQLDTNVLTIMTSNSTSGLDDNLIHRPGRIYYNFTYGGLEKDIVREVVKDNLVSTDQFEHTCEVLDSIGNLSYDVLLNIIGEMNIFNITIDEALVNLNVVSPTRADPREKEEDKNSLDYKLKLLSGYYNFFKTVFSTILPLLPQEKPKLTKEEEK